MNYKMWQNKSIIESVDSLKKMGKIVLDPETGDFIRTFLENYKKEKKISVLLASHNMSEVKRLCNSVLMMKNGTIIDNGTPEQLIKKHGRQNLEEVFLQLARNSNEF